MWVTVCCHKNDELQFVNLYVLIKLLYHASCFVDLVYCFGYNLYHRKYLGGQGPQVGQPLRDRNSDRSVRGWNLGGGARISAPPEGPRQHPHCFLYNGYQISLEVEGSGEWRRPSLFNL